MTHLDVVEMDGAVDSDIVPTPRKLRNPLDIIIAKIANLFGDKSKEVERFLRFAFVGALGAVVDFGTLFILQATILPPVDTTAVTIATTIAFIAAIISNFTWNRFWTYPDSRSRSMRRQMALFIFISVVGWLGRTLWIANSYEYLGQTLMPVVLNYLPNYDPSAAGEAKLGSMIAQLIGVVVVMFWNFFANRYWTYNDVD
jgi:putative flippase GtrA